MIFCPVVWPNSIYYNMTGEKGIITQSLRLFPGVYAECLKEKIESAEAQGFFFGRCDPVRKLEDFSLRSNWQ